MPYRFPRPPLPEALEWLDPRGYLHTWGSVAHPLCHARWIWVYTKTPPPGLAATEPPLYFHVLFEADVLPTWPLHIRETVAPPARLPHQALLELREIERECCMRQPHERGACYERLHEIHAGTKSATDT